jgi:hypothetical protein
MDPEEFVAGFYDRGFFPTGFYTRPRGPWYPQPVPRPDPPEGIWVPQTEGIDGHDDP